MGEDEAICDAQAVSVNSGCLGGFPIGVGCSVSGKGKRLGWMDGWIYLYICICMCICAWTCLD